MQGGEGRQQQSGFIFDKIKARNSYQRESLMSKRQDAIVEEAPVEEPEVTTPAEEREKVVENLCKSVEERLACIDVDELKTLHEVGVNLVDARSQELYGSKIALEVAKKLNTYKQKILFAVRFAEAYDEAAFDELKDYKTSKDEPYHWSQTHIRFLLRVKDVGERASMAQVCADENWPCRKLESEVKKAVEGSATADPKSKGSLSLTKQLEGLHTFYTRWSDFVRSQVKEETNVASRIIALKKSSESLSERQRSMLSVISSLAKPFAEDTCKLAAWLESIELS